MATRNEIVLALKPRYLTSGRLERSRILEEFAAVSGFHRKHAFRLLRGVGTEPRSERQDRRVYDDATRDALVTAWEPSDRICSRRLKALLPILLESMEWHGHATPTADIRKCPFGRILS